MAEFNLNVEDFLKGIEVGRGIVFERSNLPYYYKYNGYKLPMLPEWDIEKYPYAVIYPYGSKVYRLRLLGKDSYYHYSADTLCFGSTEDNPAGWIGYNYTSGSGTWGSIVSGSYNSIPTSGSYKPIWTNFDLEYDGTLYKAASDPVPVYRT